MVTSIFGELLDRRIILLPSHYESSNSNEYSDIRLYRASGVYPYRYFIDCTIANIDSNGSSKSYSFVDENEARRRFISFINSETIFCESFNILKSVATHRRDKPTILNDADQLMSGTLPRFRHITEESLGLLLDATRIIGNLNKLCNVRPVKIINSDTERILYDISERSSNSENSLEDPSVGIAVNFITPEEPRSQSCNRCIKYRLIYFKDSLYISNPEDEIRRGPCCRRNYGNKYTGNLKYYSSPRKMYNADLLCESLMVYSINKVFQAYSLNQDI